MCYRTASQVKMHISFSDCLMQIVFKVKLSQPYFDCNLGNHYVVKLVSVVKSVMHVWWCPFQVPYTVVCMTQFSSNFLFACKVCLKKWDLDYDSMLQLLNISRLSVCRKFLTMYNIVSGHMYFPSSIFVQSNLPYQFNCTSTFNFTRLLHILPVIRLHLVVLSWNNLPDSVKVWSSISCFKGHCII